MHSVAVLRALVLLMNYHKMAEKIHGSVYLYKQSPYEAHAIIDSYCRNNKRILSQQIIYVAKTIKSHCLNNGFTLTK